MAKKCCISILIFLLNVLIILKAPLTFGRTTTGGSIQIAATTASNKSHESNSSVVKSSDNIEKHVLEFIKQKNYEGAVNLGWGYIGVLSKYCLFKMGEAHEILKQYSEVHKLADLILGKNAKDFQALALKGRAYLAQKKENEALEAFKTATEANRHYRPAYDGLIAIYKQRENYYELRLLFEDMLKEFGPQAEFFAELCALNTKDGTNSQAVKACSKGIEKAPQNPDNYVYRGLVLKQQGDEQASLLQLKNAALKFPQSKFAQFTYAGFLEEKMNFVDATQFYKNAANLDSKDDMAWVGLARSAFQIRNYEVSYTAISNACSLNSKHISALRTLVRGIERLPSSSNSRDQVWFQKFRGLEARFDQH